MKSEIKCFLFDVCFWIASITIIIFFFTLWLFSYNEVDNSLKEAWSTTFSALSAFTTIGAAIIAAYLYNDWKEPFVLEKIEKYQNDLKKNIRLFKHSMVNFLFLIHYENSEFVQLNNDNAISLDYKKRLNNVLDNIDDLASEIKNYKSIVKWKEKPFTNEHLDSINAAENAFKNIHSILNKYDLHKEYLDSYQYIRHESSKPEFESNVRAITEIFNDELTSYFERFIAKI